MSQRVQFSSHHSPAFPLANRLLRVLWWIVCAFLFRPTPRPFHAWRNLLLRCFGATIGENCHVYPGAKIWAPWNLVCGDSVGIASGAEIYNPAPIEIGDYVTISQDAYVCGANHDYNHPDFPLTAEGITIERYAWIAARAVVLQGIIVGEGAVLAIGGIATRDLKPWTVYGGIPAKEIGQRKIAED